MDKGTRRGIMFRQLIRDFVHINDPCTYDHHGYCQAHGWFETVPKCPHARAKELLEWRST